MNVRAANIVWISGGMANQPPSNKRMGRRPNVVADNTPGGRMRGLRLKQGLSQEELADQIGIGRTQITKYEKGTHEVPEHVVLRTALRFAVTPAWIRYGDAQDDRVIAVQGNVGAGGHVEAIPYDSGRHVEIPASWDDATAFQVDGLSCYPLYEDGDIIVVRGERRLVETEFLNRMCVVETTDGRGLVKRVRRGSAAGTYTLESLNAPPIEDVVLSCARPVRMHLSR